MEISELDSIKNEMLTGDPVKSSSGKLSIADIHRLREETLGYDTAEKQRIGSSVAGYGLRPDHYDFQMKSFADNNELRANNQGFVKSFGKGLGKLFTNTAADFAGGIAGAAIGIPAAIISGDANQIFDNGVSSAITDAQNWVNEEVLPIYNTVKDQEGKNILERMLTDKEFWSNDILGEGVPFILSAWLTAYAGVGMLRPLTKAKYLSRIEAAKGLGAAATEGIAKGLQETEQWTAAFLSRTTESIVEAKDTRDQVYNSLTAKGESPEKAASEAANAAMMTFGLNYLLMPVEYIQAGTWFKNFAKSRDNLLQATKKGIGIPKNYLFNKAAKDVGINMITEGPVEENFQKAVQDYIYEQYTGSDRNQVRPWQKEFTEGANGLFSKMGENFTTKEGWDAIGAGSILGGLFGGAAAGISANSKAEKERITNVKSNLDLFNNDKAQVEERIGNIVKNLKGFDTLDKLSKIQELKGKENFWNIFESMKFGEYAFANFEAGLGQRVHDQIDEMETLSEKEFMSGYKDKGKVSELKQKATNYENLYNMITDRFQLPDTKEGRNIKQSLFREAILQDELQKEIDKATPRVEELSQRLKPTDEYGRIIRDKNSLIRENKSMNRTIKDIENSGDDAWKKLFGKKLITKLEKDIALNDKLIGKLEQGRLAFVAEQGENLVKPKSIQSNVLKDQLKLTEKNLEDLKEAFRVSSHRYDLLGQPETQGAMGNILDNVAKTTKDTEESLKKAEEHAATTSKATQVATEINKTPEKVLSNVAQVGDTVVANLKSTGEEIRGRVFETNPDGTVKNIQSNNIVHPITTLDSMVVTKKVAEETPIDDAGGNDGMYDAMLKALESGTGTTFDPFAKKEAKAEPDSGIVDYLNGLKIDTNGTANDVIRVIGAALWNSSIEVIVQAVKLGLSLAEAIQKGIEHVHKHHKGPGFDEQEYIDMIKSRGRQKGNTEPSDVAIDNPDQDFVAENYLFEERKKRVNPNALGGKDIEYTESGDTLRDIYDSDGRLVRSDQEDFYNYVDDPANELAGATGKLILVDKSGSPDSMHIRFILPNGLSTSINTTEWIKNNVANVTEAQVKAFSEWRKNIVSALQEKSELPLTIKSKGLGAYLRNEKIGGKRARRKLSSLFDKDTTPIGVTIKSKQGEEHVTRLYDWKGAPTEGIERYGFGKSGRVYIGIPAANGVVTPVPVWSRTLSEAEARLVITAIRKRFEGKNYDLIPGSTWTYNDLIRFYVYPSSVTKAFDLFISDTDKIVRIGSSRFGSADILAYPQALVVGLMGKTHQVQSKRIRTNEEVPLFSLVNNEIIVESTSRYRDYLFDSVLETDAQPIEVNGKKLFFGQPVISYDENSPFAKTTPITPKGTPDVSIDDDPFNLPAPKLVMETYDPFSKQAEIYSYNEKEMLEVMKLLPQVPISVVKDLINIYTKFGRNILAVGMFHKGLITIFENAPSGTVYHEAFHAVFRMMLSDSERKDITVKYSEEELAELFEAYMLSDGRVLPTHYTRPVESFFGRLWNMIKTFVLQMFGKVTPDDIFKRVRTGYYQHLSGDPAKFSSIAPKAYNLSPREEVSVMNYMSRMFFANIFRLDNFDNNDIESIGLKNSQVVDAYNNMKQQMMKITESAEGDLKLKYQHIVDKFDELVKSHQVWMEKYKIQPPDIEEDPEDQALKLTDSFTFRDPTEFSAKDNSNFMVKLFIAALPKMERKDGKLELKRNELNLPEVVDYSETWNFLLDKLSGLTSLDEIETRLKPYFEVKPELEIIVNLMNKPGTLTQEIFKGQFKQAFSKFHTNPITSLFRYEGSGDERQLVVTNVGTDQDSYRDSIRKSWWGNFLNSDLVDIDPHSRTDEYISKNLMIEELASDHLKKINKSKNDVAVIKTALQRFGIRFTDGAVESWIDQTENGAEKFNRAAKYIISKLADVGLANKMELFTGHEEVGNLNTLASIESQFNPSILEAVHLNPENKPSYHFIQHNLLSTIVADVNKGDTNYVTKVLNSFYGASSVWARAMKLGVKPIIKLIEGTRLEGNKGKLTTRLSPGMWISLRINNILKEKPLFTIIRPAEKKSEYGLEGFELVKSGVVRNNNGKGITAIDINSTELINQFYGYFEDEYKRTIYAYLKERKKNSADIPVSLLQYLGLNSEDDISMSSLEPFDSRGKIMTFFAPIISQSNPTLLKELENYHRPTEADIEAVRLAIKSYLVKNINDNFDYLNDNSIIQVKDENDVHKTSRTAAYQKLKVDGTNLNIDNVTIGRDALRLYAGDIFAAVSDFTVNEMISSFEYVKLTMGDPAYYKDFFKRAPLVVGTGKTARVDRSIANYIVPEYNKIRSKYPLTKSEEEVIAGEMKLAVVYSPHKKSSQLDEFKTQLKSLGLKDTEVNTLLKGYEDYDEADAFSWMTPQAVREFLLRIGDWNPSLESVYNNILEGKQVNYKKLKNFLTAIKLMGAGPINTGDNNIMAMAYLKTATLPLIPRMIKGRALEHVLERMYKSGTDMLIVDSGSKGASYDIQDFYDERGDIDRAVLDNGTLNFKYVKLQIDVAQKAKLKVVFGTQLRKLIWSNIFQYDKDGKLVEREYTVDGKKLSTSALWSRFNKSYERLTKLYKDKILKELGINFDIASETYTVVDWKNLVDRLKKESQKRFYPKTVVDSIKLNAEGNGLDIPGDALVNRKMIENMTNALIYNTVIKQKMPGSSSVQVPVTGFEEDTKTKTKTDSTGELKFISYDSKAGRVMEAEVYLPHNFRAKFGYLNDLTIEQVDADVLQMVGFRIPTEGLRSIIKIKVKGFLPAESGQIVVVPSELVAQAGSDFDIDKLSIMQPHYFYDEEAKRIRKVSSSNDSIEGVENNILDMVDGLLSHKDSFVASLRTTGETVDYLKSLALGIKKLKGDTSTKETDPLSIIEFQKKMEIALKFIAGKDGVSVAARHNAHHVLTQVSNLTLTKDATEILSFKFNKDKNGNALLSGKQDVSKKHDILDITAASVNGFVDIVKDPFIVDLFTDLNTAGVALTMVRLGASVEWVSKFVNQPLIQRYIHNSDFARSEVGQISGLTGWTVLNKLREEYFNRLDERGKALVDTDTWELKAGIFKHLDITQLDKFIAVGYDNGRVDDGSIQNNSLLVPPNDYYLAQLSLLNDFLKYSVLNSKLRMLMDNSTSDTAHAKTYNDADRFVRRKEQRDIADEERLESIFQNYDDLFNLENGEPTFIETFYQNGMKLQHEAFNEIFPIRQSDRVQNAVKRIESYIGRTNTLRDYEIERISDSLMGYIMYSSLNKQEIRDFVLDQYQTPEQRLLVSPRMRYNLVRGNVKGFIKRGHYYSKGDRLNLNGVYSVEIVGVNELTPKQLIERNPNMAKILGAKFYKPATKKVYLYDTKLVKNELIRESVIRHIHGYKISKNDTPFIKELQENLLIKNLRINFSTKANGVNSISFRARPTDNITQEDLTDSWRNLFNSGDPDIRSLADKLARYAIYQSGLKQTNISFWRYVPPEEFSKIVHGSLEAFDEHLDNPSVLSKVFKNLWKYDIYVPRVKGRQVREIVNGKGDVIGYVLRRDNNINSKFFAKNTPPPFLKIEDSGQDILMELVGFSAERQGGDAIYQATSKLGDGTLLTEFHEGESIYEDNNHYIEGISGLYDQVQSSAPYWKASAPLSPPAITEESETTTQDFAGDQDTGGPTDQGGNDEDGGGQFGQSWVDSFGFQLKTQDERKPLTELDNLLRGKLAEIGVDVRSVDRIITKAGSAVAVAKVLHNVIEVVKGQADITTLPEEAAHMFVAMLDPKSPLMEKMLREISDYNVYKETLSEYYEVYNGDDKALRIEAVGKLIANIIVNDFTGEKGANIERAKNWWNRLWEVLKRILSKVTLGAISEYTTNSPSVYQEFAKNIVSKKTSRTLAESVINNNFDSIILQLTEQGYLKKECI